MARVITTVVTAQVLALVVPALVAIVVGTVLYSHNRYAKNHIKLSAGNCLL